MSDLIIGFFILAGFVVAILLLRYILSTLKKLKHLELAQTQAVLKHEQALDDARLNASDSIKVLAQCMLDEQIELSEGCIRIKVLLDHVAPEFHEDPYFRIFSKIYASTRHMPTHQARKDTDKKIVMKYDLERLALEDEHKEEILAASRQLLSRLT